jgi:hypothetical protein
VEHDKIDHIMTEQRESNATVVTYSVGDMNIGDHDVQQISPSNVARSNFSFYEE